MPHFAMVIVATGTDPDDAWENLTSNGHLTDAATFVGDPWNVEPLTSDGADPVFDTGDAIEQRRVRLGS